MRSKLLQFRLSSRSGFRDSVAWPVRLDKATRADFALKWARAKAVSALADHTFNDAAAGEQLIERRFQLAPVFGAGESRRALCAGIFVGGARLIAGCRKRKQARLAAISSGRPIIFGIFFK